MSPHADRQTQPEDSHGEAPRVYLDNNATTAILGAAADASDRAMRVSGNPSSLHAAGRATARVLSDARGRVASWLGAPPREIVFTSGGTEALRLGILGALMPRNGRRDKRHVVASAIEHSVLPWRPPAGP